MPVKEIIRLAHAQRHARARRRQPGRRAHDASTCAISTATSTSSPATRPTGRPASACSTPRSEHLDAMPPYQGGGDMIESVTVDRITYGKPPHKFEAGTPAIVRGDRARRRAQLHDAGRAREASRATRPSLEPMRTQRLAELPWLKIYGTAPGKGAIVSFTHRRAAPARHLDRSSTARASRCAPAITARSR